MFAVSITPKGLQVKRSPSIAQLRAHYPVNSRWEVEHRERWVVFEVIAHQRWEGHTIMLVEYQRWHNVGGWVGSGRAEWLEVVVEDGEYVLYTYTDAYGVLAA